MEETADIFDREKIKIMSYDMYSRLRRHRLLRTHNGEYYYMDRYTDKVRKLSHRLNTLSDYDDYLILVY
ncbi:agip124 [Agrotis ipsilon multiple nucleopolyhedrovirus]|uniref:Uncharacterized protein n=1 Tax=Agrotis ipsilon multiple nucleopolyhedrovirus TaxID=208013 RepID=B6D638_9ABAC|nr:agip124 [Agrotis ipsilon multiple nucleopolyhedrovirus]ACI28825.1 unknown [Agrotis ipsilon multiple nucleopolyhedrovirus]